MARKKSKKESKKKPARTASIPNAPQPVKAEGDDDRFDFGGLPDRNLKKNLGCG